MFARGNPFSGAVGAANNAAGQSLRADVKTPASARRVERYAPWWLAGVSESGFLALWMAADLAIIGVTGLLSHWLRFGTPDLNNARVTAVVIAVVVAWLVFRHFGAHTMRLAARPLTHLRIVSMAVLSTFLIVATVGYITKTGEDFSRLWGALWVVWALLAVVATRAPISNAYRRLEAAGTFDHRYVLFTSAAHIDLAGRVLRRWQGQMPRSDSVAAIFVDNPNAVPDTFTGHDLIAGSFDDFAQWHGRSFMDRAVLVMPPDDHKRLEPVLDRLGIVALDVDLIAGDVDETWASRPVNKIAGLPSVRVMTRPLDARQHMVKRVEDVVIASVALVLLSPLMLLTALAVKLDSPGPVFFKQPRHGFNNSTFHVLKFRSMRNAQVDPGANVVQATKQDPRVTRVGAFIRRTSIDELPQLFNVLRGDMSIVGPRPHAIQHNDHYAQRIRSYLGRHRVRPGLTGWAAVNGCRGETETLEKMQKRVEYDLYYVDNWSLTFDLRCVLMTVRCLIHPNAY